MPSADGPDGPGDHRSDETPLARNGSMERQLFESLIHHLVEKGILTKNDALSVVQTVAEVKRGELDSGPAQAAVVEREIVILERLYASFQAMSARGYGAQILDGENILQLRPPLHGDKPKFPRDD